MDFQHLFWLYAQHNKPILAGNFICALAVPALELVVMPSLFGNLLEMDPHASTRCISVIALVACALQLVHVVRNRITSLLVPSFDSFVKVYTLENLLANGSGCQPPTSGDIVFMLTTASEMCQTWLEWLNDHIIPCIAIVLCSTFAFMRCDRVLVCALAIFFVVVLLLVYYCSWYCKDMAKDHAAAMSHLHSHFEDLIRNMTAIQSGGTCSQEMRRLQEDGLPTDYRGYDDTARCSRMFQMVFIPVFLVFFLVCLHRCMHLIKHDQMDKAQLVSVFLIMTTLLSTVAWMSDTMSSAIIDVGHTQHMSKDAPEMAQHHWPDSAPMHRPPDPSLYIIGMSHVTFAHGSTAVLTDVSLDFERGHLTALVGDIGHGKSTVLKLMLGFCVPQEGQMYLDGQWYAEITEHFIRTNVYIVPQTAVLFDASIVYNVRYGNEDRYTTDEVRHFILEMAPDALAERLAVDSVGVGGERLSGGQRQLVWCLRAVLRAPKVLLLDEPTASMDETTKDVLMRLLQVAVTRGVTVILVSHDPRIVAACSRVVTLHKEIKTQT